MEPDYSEPFKVSPQDVLGQSRQEGYYYPERAMMAKRAGFNPLAEAAPLFQSKKRTGGGQGDDAYAMAMKQAAKEQAREKEPSIFARDAEFYANEVEDFGAAAALTGSKNGRSIFQMYDPYEFDMGLDEKNPKGQPRKSTFRIIPRGSRQVPTPDGIKELPLHAYANQFGVSNVPFKGGDEAADNFRGLLTDGQILLSNLSRLEQIYRDETLLTGFGYSNASTEARGLEAMITKDFMKVMTGTKGLGGNVSDKDMSFAQSMTPQRASSWFTRFKGNEMALIKQVRHNAIQKLKGAAHANGVDFLVEDSDGGNTSKHDLYDNNSTTLE